MQQQQDQAFGIHEARRVLGDVLAAWVKELDLSVEGFDFDGALALLRERAG